MLDPEIVESAIADALIELQPSADALFSGTATLGNLLDGQVSENDAVGPWVWRARRDSNPRPTGSKPAALSN